MTSTGPIDVGGIVRQIPAKYPFVLVDRVLRHDAEAGTLAAVKTVSGSEDFFEGHFPGAPVMPGVLIMESLAQAAGIFLIHGSRDPSRAEVRVVGIDHAKFRRPVVPGDKLELHVRLEHRRGSLCRFRGEVRCGEHRVAEAELLLQAEELAAPAIDPLARVSPGAQLGPGVHVGPFCIIGENVKVGRDTVFDSHVVVGGDTIIGAANRFFPFVSIGLEPQDLKYGGEASRVEIGDRNVFREFVTVNRGTDGGGGLTSIGSDNLLMTQVHIAHDCHVGNHTIFANAASLAGHVVVEDYASLGGFTGVHQFCRVGQHAFTGGFTAVRKDVLPFSLTVGDKALLYGLNAIGLRRRGMSKDAISALRRAVAQLWGGTRTAEALAEIEAEPMTDEVKILVDFVRSSRRGVTLERGRSSDSDADA
jgi:UDP-N-acetylglucosamine acyltransferase